MILGRGKYWQSQVEVQHGGLVFGRLKRYSFRVTRQKRRMISGVVVDGFAEPTGNGNAVEDA